MLIRYKLFVLLFLFVISLVSFVFAWRFKDKMNLRLSFACIIGAIFCCATPLLLFETNYSVCSSQFCEIVCDDVSEKGNDLRYVTLPDGDSVWISVSHELIDGHSIMLTVVSDYDIFGFLVNQYVINSTIIRR